MDEKIKLEKFDHVYSILRDIYKKKNSDYGNSFESSLEKFGLVAGVIRLSDKQSRLENLLKSESQVLDETIDDTLIDMANYAIMTAIWRIFKSNKIL